MASLGRQISEASFTAQQSPATTANFMRRKVREAGSLRLRCGIANTIVARGPKQVLPWNAEPAADSQQQSGFARRGEGDARNIACLALALFCGAQESHPDRLIATGLKQCRQGFCHQHIPIPRIAQDGGQPLQFRDDWFGVRRPENAYRKTQTPQCHAQLVNVLGVVAGDCTFHVCAEVADSPGDDCRHRLMRRPIALEFDGFRP